MTPLSVGAPADGRHPRVCVLHVVHGVLHRLLRHDVEIEGLRGVDPLQQEREARDVGIDLVENVGERDDRAGATRQAHELTAALESHELTEDHLGLGRRLGADPQRAHADLERLHLTVVVGAPDVDQVIPPPCDLVAVVREVVGQVGGRSVGAHQHAVALVAERLGRQPLGAVRFERVPGATQIVEHGGHGAGVVQRLLGEPRVEAHTDPFEVVTDPLHRPPHTPRAGLLTGDAVTEVGPHLAREVDEVRALVAVLGRLTPLVAGHERRRERVQLTPGVVQVVLAMDRRALCGEEVRDRVAHGDPSTAAGVQRARRVHRHELQVDARAGVRVAVTELLAVGHHSGEHVVQPRRREEEVDEPGARDLDALHVTRRRRGQGVDESRRDVARRRADLLREHEGHVGLPVAVVPRLRRCDLDAVGRHGQVGRGQRRRQSGDEVGGDHGASSIPHRTRWTRERFEVDKVRSVGRANAIGGQIIWTSFRTGHTSSRARFRSDA